MCCWIQHVLKWLSFDVSFLGVEGGGDVLESWGDDSSSHEDIGLDDLMTRLTIIVLLHVFCCVSSKGFDLCLVKWEDPGC